MHTSTIVHGIHAANSMVSSLRSLGISAFITCCTDCVMGTYEVRAIDMKRLDGIIQGMNTDIHQVFSK